MDMDEEKYLDVSNWMELDLEPTKVVFRQQRFKNKEGMLKQIKNHSKLTIDLNVSIF